METKTLTEREKRELEIEDLEKQIKKILEVNEIPSKLEKRGWEVEITVTPLDSVLKLHNKDALPLYKSKVEDITIIIGYFVLILISLKILHYILTTI